MLRPAVKEQLAAEIIFLTHNDKLHHTNLGWHPKGEEYLWTPDLREHKYSQTGGRNLRYKRGFKAELVDSFCTLLTQTLPSAASAMLFRSRGGEVAVEDEKQVSPTRRIQTYPA